MSDWPVPLRWMAYALALHLIWEIGQLPLFTLWYSEPPHAIAWAVIHCTAGDALIAAFTYAAAALATRDVAWPVHSRRMLALPVVVISGVGYTFFSEWRNVYILESWAYASTMPMILGIGISPLAQWIIVPVLATLLTARRSRPGGRFNATP